jgi:hypothetical protein
MSYVSEVADLICSLNTNNAVLGAHDYLVISEWEKQEIPLEIVLTTLREYFAEQESAAEGALVVIKREIRNRYAEWLRGVNPISM